MDRSTYIIATQRQGWLLYSSNLEGLVFRCGAPGCRSAIFAPESMIGRGELPEACDCPHVEAEGAPIETYADAMRVLADARRRLGIDQSDTGEAAGLADGHLNKLEAGWRRATLPVFLDLCATLGLSVILAPAPVPRQTAAVVEGRAMRPMMARWRLIPARLLGDDRPPAIFSLIPARKLDEDREAAA